MTAGVHVEVVVDGVETCPVSAISTECEVESIHTTPRAVGGGVVGELTVEDGPSGELEDHGTDVVFADGEREIHRFVTEEADCPCGHIPDHGCPVRTVSADDGSLCLSFVAPSVQTVRDVVADLESCTGTVRLRRLTRSSADGTDELLFIERDAFTDRQYEALATAHEMGYFDTPRRVDSTDVADQLGISGATFSEHLAVAQRKLFDQLLTA
ncbi:helix-turn-helix domain-containing protein [Halomarina rubra]|uniref:Helix-turn-helix domain-containing protein n=1 Tax=Halomarina rubra TaxID=2071873 RepID=A0ABD6AZB6_9EURY|nr:helix-turn-helix domain-containing protein [Halomarina rubra]